MTHVSKMSNEALLFHYFTNKQNTDELYKRQKEIEEEIKKRIPQMKELYQKGLLKLEVD